MSASIGLLLLVLTQTAATAAIAARDEDIDSDIDSDFDSDSDSDSDPTQTQSSATHTIKVGPREDPHQYVPKETDASIGDTILFEFYPRNHSVVQADFLVPCIPRAGGFFDSGNFNEFDEKNGQLVGEVCSSSSIHFFSDRVADLNLAAAHMEHGDPDRRGMIELHLEI